MVRSIDGPDRWVRLYTYPRLGLRAMTEAGLLSMTEVWPWDIPGLDEEILASHRGDAARFGDEPTFWRLSVPVKPAEGTDEPTDATDR